MDKGHQSYTLFRALSSFCAISYSYCISEEQRLSLGPKAEYIIKACKELETEVIEYEGSEEESNPNYQDEDEAEREIAAPVVSSNSDDSDEPLEVNGFKVFSKLHTLLHYKDLIAKYGPLNHFSTLTFERKHYFFKIFAPIMRNYVNPPLSFAKRQQIHMAVSLKETNFENVNFFWSKNANLTIDLLPSISTQFKLPSREVPHPLNKEILRFIKNKQASYWIKPVSYWRDSNGMIYAYGDIYSLAKNSSHSWDSRTSFEPERLQLKFDKRFVADQHLHHVKDFLSTEDRYFILIRGLL